MPVYLLHLCQPLDRGVSPNGTALIARHYIGYADNLDGRLHHHRQGTGARFMQVCCERGIDWTVARVWEGEQADRTFERRLKNGKWAPRLCPLCNPNALKLMQMERAQ